MKNKKHKHIWGIACFSREYCKICGKTNPKKLGEFPKEKE